MYHVCIILSVEKCTNSESLGILPKLIKCIQVFRELISIHISIRNLSATMESPSLESQYGISKIPEQPPSNRTPEQPPSNSPYVKKGQKKRKARNI